jgi:hypothetical protein
MRTQGELQWRVIADGIPFGTNEFTATNLEYGLVYELQVEAFNDAGRAEGCDIYEVTFTPILCPNQV